MSVCGFMYAMYRDLTEFALVHLALLGTFILRYGECTALLLTNEFLPLSLSGHMVDRSRFSLRTL